MKTKLKALRQAGGLTLRELADALHLDYSTVGHIERGRRDFSIQSLIAACRYFSVSPNEMLLWETKEPVEPLPKELIDGSNKLRELRRARGLTSIQLAKILNLSESAVRYIERGERSFSMKSLKRACSYFGVSADYLLGASSTTETPKSASQEQIYTKTEPGNHKELFRKTKLGYVQVYLPTSPMAGKDGWVLLHRAVMAEHLGRPLRPEEVVHHIDGDPGNNKLSNLMLFPNNAEHRKYHGQLKRDAEIKRLLNE